MTITVDLILRNVHVDTRIISKVNLVHALTLPLPVTIEKVFAFEA